MPNVLHLARIRRPIGQVFAAVGDANRIGLWFVKAVADQYVVGASLTLDFGYETVSFEITARDENECIAWRCTEPQNQWFGTTIAFEFEDLGDHTLVRFDHSGWSEPSDFMRECSMSWAYFLESLRLYLETGTGTPERI